MYIPVTPIAKPRMTRSDKWKQRPVVVRYRQFKDELRESAPSLQNSVDDVVWLIFVIPMPKSWSKKKKAKMLGLPHQQTPDKDNLEKAFLDATMKEDKAVHEGHVKKVWGEKGGIYYGQQYWLPQTTQNKEKRQGAEQEPKEITGTIRRGVAGKGSVRMRGVSPRVHRR